MQRHINDSLSNDDEHALIHHRASVRGGFRGWNPAEEIETHQKSEKNQKISDGRNDRESQNPKHQKDLVTRLQECQQLNVIPNIQFGLRSRHSTPHPLLQNVQVVGVNMTS